MTKPWPPEVILEGEHVRLEPLSHAYADGLRLSVGDLHKLWYTPVPTPDAMDAEIDRRLGLRAAGSMLPFAVISPVLGRPVGMTTYMHIDAATPRVEIGSTWISEEVQRTLLNTEAKYLMLDHAFELGCTAVEFRTHFMNRQSRAAIERLGAKLDGVLRAHMKLANGTVRDTAVYSITAAEWPSVRSGLLYRLGRE